MKKNQKILIVALLVCVIVVTIVVFTSSPVQDPVQDPAPSSDPVSDSAPPPLSNEDSDDESADLTPGCILCPIGRYVRFSFHDGTPPKYILAPKEIKVFDMQGVNVALNKPVTAHGHHSKTGYPKENAVDGDENTIWHSRHGGDTDWIEIDLEEEVEISKIIITQGTGTTVYNGVAGWARMSGGGPDSGDKGSYITIKGADQEVILETEDIKTVAAKYTYDFTKEDGTWD